MSDGTFRYDDLLRVMQEARRLSAPAFGPIVETAHARTPDRPVTWVTLPRPSRHRSRRVRKKLLKRSARPGVTWEPLMFVAGGATFAHPLVVADLRRSVPEAPREWEGNPLFRGVTGGFW